MCRHNLCALSSTRNTEKALFPGERRWLRAATRVLGAGFSISIWLHIPQAGGGVLGTFQCSEANCMVTCRREAAHTLEEGFVEQLFRIGEASNPGPYSVGGASSSASLPALGPVVSRSAEELAASEPPELSAAAAYGTTHGLHGVPSRVLSRASGVSPFDDQDKWNFAEESAHFEGSAQARVDFAAGARSPRSRWSDVSWTVCGHATNFQVR